VLFNGSENEKLISGKEIRKRIVNNESWREFVPKEVYEYISSHDITIRLLQLVKTEQRPNN